MGSRRELGQGGRRGAPAIDMEQDHQRRGQKAVAVCRKPGRVWAQHVGTEGYACRPGQQTEDPGEGRVGRINLCLEFSELYEEKTNDNKGRHFPSPFP